MADTDLKTALNQFAVQIRNLKAEINALKAKPGGYLSFRDEQMAKAAAVIPFYYVISIALTSTTTNRTPGSVNISQSGWFFLDRIYASWIPSAGAEANTWQPIASSNPFIAGSAEVAGAAVGTTINFFFEISEGRAQRNRQNVPIPGDILFRGDADGFPAGGDAYGPNSTVFINVTPTVAPGQNGTLYFTLSGMHCLDILQQ